MGDTVILAVYFPIIIGGMLLMIAWGMSAAGFHRTGSSHGESDRTQSREI